VAANYSLPNPLNSRHGMNRVGTGPAGSHTVVIKFSEQGCGLEGKKAVSTCWNEVDFVVPLLHSPLESRERLLITYMAIHDHLTLVWGCYGWL